MPADPQMQLPKAYDPAATEDRIYASWEKSGAFTADEGSLKEPFTISMPPPNATGHLHLGHTVMLATEDIFIRFARMRGKETLWVPGTDHASIATESVVIREIQQKEHIPDPRAKLGREELLRRIAEYVERSRDTIRSQVRKMGASCDWSRERYTLEPTLNRCVNEVFVRMCRDGLIYRGHRIVNWDPKMQTTVSDDEIERIEERAQFYTFQYGPFQISTSRPETKFGDKYVVMHPDDERYKKYTHGDTFVCEWINGPIKATIIKDKAVDPAFGTGVMTITPWHDAVDFDIAQRHGLEKEQIIGFDGRLLHIAGPFAGMPIADARPKITELLKQKGLLVSIKEDYIHNVARNYRGGGLIEPQIKEQWFVDVSKRVVPWKSEKMNLKEILQEVVRSKEIRLIPERSEKEYFHWIDHLRDWCISRQVWWGHRVPVWTRQGDCCIEVHVGTHPPEGADPARRSPKGEAGWEQDPDTLDTWFSAALWTWSTLIDPEVAKDPSLTLEELLQKSPDFQKFHPTSVLETGYDILFFWVARMILMTVYATGQIPFKTVYLHGLVRTREGKKMSKSNPKTTIDPVAMITKYGADALRLSMIVGQSPGNDFRLYEEKIAGYRNFVNKLWNAARFVLMECEKGGVDSRQIPDFGGRGGSRTAPTDFSLVDRALLHAVQDLIDDVTNGLEEYCLSEVGEKLYGFIWDFFCDWYLEFSKGQEGQKSLSLEILVHVFRILLRLLHPYVPFVTEELWSSFKPENAGMLIREEWPVADPSLRDPKAWEHLRVVIDVITAIRSVRSEYGVEAGKQIAAVLVTRGETSTLLEKEQEHIRRLARIESLTIQGGKYEGNQAASKFVPNIEIYLPLDALVDRVKERTRLEKEKNALRKFLEGLETRLKNTAFVQNAPSAVLEKEQEKEREVKMKLAKIEERLGTLR